MRYFCKGLLALAATVVLSLPSNAATLNPGAVVFPTGTTAADPVHGGAQIVRNDDQIKFRMDPTPLTLMNLGGVVQNRVTELASGFLNFAPRIRDTINIDGGTFGILGFRIDGYAGWSTEVEFRTDGLGDKGPTSVSRSADGDILTFRYDSPLLIDTINPPGRRQESLFPTIVTDAEHFAKTGTMEIFGRLGVAPVGTGLWDPTGDLISVSIEGIAVPTVAAVPLPAPALMLLAGLGVFAGLARRTRA